MWLHVPITPPPTGAITIAGFCAGVGMLERSIILALEARGIRAGCVCHCEWEAVAAACLVGLGQKTDHEAPVWDDMRTFDGRRWRGLVDIACAGLPCPAFSSAGARGGNDDERAWGKDGDGPQSQFLRIVDEMRPALVWLENVGEWISGGHFRRFGERLCGMGFEIQSPLFVTAESVGAPHERERVFVLAVAGGGRGRELLARWRSGGGDAFGGRSTELADGDGEPLHEIQRAHGPKSHRGGTELAIGAGGGCGAGRQSSGGDGFVDGGNPVVADGAERRCEDASGQHRGKSDPLLVESELAEPVLPRSQGSGFAEPGGGRRSADGGGQLGDTQHRGRQTGDEDAGGIGGAEGGTPTGTQLRRGELLKPLGDAQHGQAGDGAAGEAGGSQGQSGRLQGVGSRVDRLPIFPPHRSDFPAWALALGVEAAVAPAIESRLPMVVNGIAVAHADLLRIGGNSCVVGAAAAAFYVITSRANLNPSTE